jgi:hypothetical protein
MQRAVPTVHLRELMMPPRNDSLLSYCMNVHPTETLEELEQALLQHAAPIAKSFTKDSFPAGLWLSKNCVDQLASKEARDKLRQTLHQHSLEAFSVNAFPIGGFHGQSVKSKVYRPTWTRGARLHYSQNVAEVLAALLPEHQKTGTISTVPLSFKSFHEDIEDMLKPLQTMAVFLQQLEQRTGKEIILCLEPEPFCLLETSAECLAFFSQKLFQQAHGDICRRYIGLCFDTCHLACQWEDLRASISAIEAAGIRIPKAQISVALELQKPGANPRGVKRLQSFVEPRYLHQSIASNGLRAEDLPQIFQSAGQLKSEWQAAPAIRTHFHVPIFWSGDDAIATTKSSLQGVIPALLDAGCRHFEVETYSWNVIPEETRNELADDLNGMVLRELECARAMFPETGP